MARACRIEIVPTHEDLVAHHEAGHFAAAYASGFEPRYVTIDGSADGTKPHCYLDEPKTKVQAIAKVVALYAGYEAELKICGKAGRKNAVIGASQDFRFAVAMIAEHLTPRTERELARWKKLFREQARKFVAEIWPVVKLIATELKTYRTVTLSHARMLVQSVSAPPESLCWRLLTAYRIMCVATQIAVSLPKDRRNKTSWPFTNSSVTPSRSKPSSTSARATRRA